MEYQAVDHIQPTWKITDQFLVDVVAPALELDSLTTSHPVSVDVTDPNEIKAIFDTISYKKVIIIINIIIYHHILYIIYHISDREGGSESVL